jgi:hypothetical protein
MEKYEIDGACSAYGERRGVYRVLVGKREGERPLGRPKRRWEDNTKMGFKGIDVGGMDWIELASDKNWWRTCVKEVMNLRVPQNAGNFLTS